MTPMRKYFITGLIILLPIALTLALLVFLVNLLTAPFLGIMEAIVLSTAWAKKLYETVPGADKILHYTSRILVLIFLFGFTVLLGMITRWFFFKSLLKLGDHILHRIPLVNKIYKTSQDIIKTLFSPETKSFKQVVMVPFPQKSSYCIGLVSGDAPARCKATAKSDLISVFVPTTPNPTSGYLLMFPREECHFIDMKVEEAVKFIVSCGVIHHDTPEFPSDISLEP